eukprot:CAMPEP_0118809826 /NCGR_PEP_ID=MMETSP1162-20130426/582_1 /TAXON_ID=33656 /ORGANISM="Phaeocystis Sp, Strain CCMP2710" /LENGTH=133 /DNA_ID=CAMNT_0006739295 /DNA_START=282 /DNA_END=681 /DNA_ORIENTATION=-
MPSPSAAPAPHDRAQDRLSLHAAPRSCTCRGDRGRSAHREGTCGTDRPAPIAQRAAATRAAARSPRALARPRSIGACAAAAAAMARRNVRRWLRGRLVLGRALLAACRCYLICQARGAVAAVAAAAPRSECVW